MKRIFVIIFLSMLVSMSSASYVSKIQQDTHTIFATPTYIDSNRTDIEDRAWNGTCLYGSNKWLLRYNRSLPYTETNDGCYNLFNNTWLSSTIYFTLNKTYGERNISLYNASFQFNSFSSEDGSGSNNVSVWVLPNWDSGLVDILNDFTNPSNTWDFQPCNPSYLYDNRESSNCDFIGEYLAAGFNTIYIGNATEGSPYPIVMIMMNNYGISNAIATNFHNAYTDVGMMGWGGNISTTTTSTTTTTLYPPISECTSSANCTNGTLCLNGTCVITSDQCYIDDDCPENQWCRTRGLPNTCEYKLANGTRCYRNHNCLSDDCVAHLNNSASGDYPPDYATYSYVGVCRGTGIDVCTLDAQCNATSFCRIWTPNNWGLCDIKRGEGSVCLANSWCTVDLVCINGVCVNSSTYTGDECNPQSPNYYTAGKPIWSSCNALNSTLCNTDDACFCGKLTNTSTKNTCIPRVNEFEKCSLFMSSIQSFEDRYTDRDEACYISYVCRGQSTGGEPKRVCMSTTYECLRNRDPAGNIYSGSFLDEYCQIGKYCNEGAHACIPTKAYQSPCTNNYECQSYLCLGGYCALGNLSVGNTFIEMTASTYTLHDDFPFFLTASMKTKEGAAITGASCNINYNDAYFNVTNPSMFSSGSLYMSEMIYTKADTITRNRTIGVTCSKTDYDPASAYVTITILGTGDVGPTTIPASLNCVSCPIGDRTGSGIILTMKYYQTSNGVGITGATCSVDLDDISGYDYLDESLGGGQYTTMWTITVEGTHTYTITCSKSGYTTETSSGSFTVVSDLCSNGRQDYGEEGVDCGGICVRRCPTQCNNGIRDIDESGIDCGGTSKCPRCIRCVYGETDIDTLAECSCTKNSDCESDFCRLWEGNQFDTTSDTDRHCRIPTCTDGWKNGGESQLDCGGACPVCPCSDPYSLDGCADDGSETCDVDSGSCKLWTCTDQSNCTEILIRENGQLLSKDRICLDGICQFKSTPDYINATINMKVYSLKNLIWENGTTFFYIGYCSDFSNGLRVVTDKATHTQYQMGDASPFTPAIVSSITWKTFGTDGKDKTALIPELCNWGSGSMRFARIGVHSELVNTGYKEDKSVMYLIFKEDYRVNFTGESDSIRFSANRPSHFWIRSNTYDPWIQLNTLPSDSLFTYYRNITNTTAIEWFANSTYSETRSGIYTRDAKYLLIFLLATIWDILFAWWLPTWSFWFIIPISFGIVVVLPLAIMLFLYFYLKSRETRG